MLSMQPLTFDETFEIEDAFEEELLIEKFEEVIESEICKLVFDIGTIGLSL